MSRVTITIALLFLLFSSAIFSQDLQTPPRETRLIGDGEVTLSEQTKDRLFGISPKTIVGHSDVVKINWKNAYIEGDGQIPYPVDMDLTLTLGQTMQKDLAFVSKIEAIRGTIRPVDSSHKVARVSLSTRGTWIGLFHHNSTTGPNHLAFEAPIGLYDLDTDALLAQTNVIVGFDLNNPKDYKASVVIFSPLKIFANQRIATSDISKALSSKDVIFANKVSPSFYYAELSSAELKTAEGSGHMLKWLDDASLALYECGSDEFMELEFHSLGFSDDKSAEKTPFSLSLRYRPRLNYVNSYNQKVAFIEPLDGFMTLHYDDLDRVIPVGPGNHGDVDSRIMLANGKLNYQLALNFSEEGQPIALAKVEFTCSVEQVSGSSCTDMRITDAVDQTGNSMSKRSIADVMGRPAAFISEKSFYQDQKALVALKGGPACPEFAECPNCLTEGCLTGSSTCRVMGINCSGGNCENQTGTQCCKGGFGAICCRTRCAPRE